MKTFIKKLFVLPTLLVGLALIPAGRVTAQTFTPLYTFTLADVTNNGSGPNGMVLSGNTLYGTAASGGSSGDGTVFAVNTNGTGFMNLHSFNGFSEGGGPNSGVILSGNTLYGTTYGNGSSGQGGGTVFKINTDGTGFTVLHSFTSPVNAPTNSGGSYPFGPLVISGSTLYGTTEGGGSSAGGTVFAVNTDGSGFTILYNFDGATTGYGPVAGVIVSGNVLYGAVRFGGSLGQGLGTLFKINTDGSGFTILHNFAGSDGGRPIGGLLLSGTTLYGTTTAAAFPSQGTVFKIDVSGSGFTVLHGFNANSDGSTPFDSLILSGTTLYGTAYYGGSFDKGTVFALETNGTGFTNLYTFTKGSDGSFPQGGLILSGNTLYGTSQNGSSGVAGTVFSLTLPSLCAPAVLDIQKYSGLTITGTVGCTYVIEWRPDNGNGTPWTPLATNTLSSSPYFYLDPTPIQGNRFYRAVVP